MISAWVMEGPDGKVLKLIDALKSCGCEEIHPKLLL